MKIESVRLQNFRAFEDDTIVLDEYTCLVGPNGSGKSTILTALNIFFRETASASTDLVNLSKEDFHKCATFQPVQVTLTLTEIDSDAAADLKAYVRQGKLVISAVAEWDEGTQSAQVKQYGQRLGIEQFRAYFDKDKAGAQAKELHGIFAGLRQTFQDLPDVKPKSAMEKALHDYESSHPDKCILIPSEDQFYGVSRGTNLLQKYLQWVFIPAVKDATTEQAEAKNTALGRLLARRVHAHVALNKPIDQIKQQALRQYQELLNSNAPALKGLSDSLNTRFKKWAHQNASIRLDWQDGEGKIAISQPTAEIAASEGVFEGELARFGHGLQRSFIFALLEEQAEYRDTGPRLILACEEPELYQHPPQARYLASLLQRLSSQNAQVLLCTHSPYFATGKTFEQIRMVNKDPQTGRTKIAHATFDQIAQTIADAKGEKPSKPGGIAVKVEQELQGQMNEMFFASVRVFVEGIEDLGYISSYLSLLDLWDEFRGLGCHLIQVQGKGNLIYAVALANHLKLPCFTVFDADGDTPPDTSEKPTGKRAKHERDNLAILRLSLADKPVAFPDDTLWRTNVVCWKTKIGDVVEADIGTTDLRRLKEEVCAKYGIFVHDKDKSSLFIAYLMAEAWEQGKKSSTLEKLCRMMIEYAKSVNVPVKREVVEVVATIPLPSTQPVT
jgi:putative ATP-dependent endonuclease of OLD family